MEESLRLLISEVLRKYLSKIDKPPPENFAELPRFFLEAISNGYTGVNKAFVDAIVIRCNKPKLTEKHQEDVFEFVAKCLIDPLKAGTFIGAPLIDCLRYNGLGTEENGRNRSPDQLSKYILGSAKEMGFDIALTPRKILSVIRDGLNLNVMQYDGQLSSQVYLAYYDIVPHLNSDNIVDAGRIIGSDDRLPNHLLNNLSIFMAVCHDFATLQKTSCDINTLNPRVLERASKWVKHVELFYEIKTARKAKRQTVKDGIGLSDLIQASALRRQDFFEDVCARVKIVREVWARNDLERGVHTDEEGRLFYNPYQRPDYSMMPIAPHEEVQKFAEVIKKHTVDLCGGDEQVASYLLQTLAYTVQPHRDPLRYGILLYGSGEGAGKSIFYDLAEIAIGNDFCGPVSNEALNEKFNAWQYNMFMVKVEEVVQKNENQNKLTGMLKEYIGQTTFSVREMQHTAVRARTTALFFLTSNEPRPIKIGTKERRLLVIRTKLKRSEERSRKLTGMINFYKKHPRYIVDFFMSIDTTEVKQLTEAPSTEWKKELADKSIAVNPLHKATKDCLEQLDWPDAISRPAVKLAVKANISKNRLTFNDNMVDNFLETLGYEKKTENREHRTIISITRDTRKKITLLYNSGASRLTSGDARVLHTKQMDILYPPENCDIFSRLNELFYLPPPSNFNKKHFRCCLSVSDLTVIATNNRNWHSNRKEARGLVIDWLIKSNPNSTKDDRDEDLFELVCRKDVRGKDFCLSFPKEGCVPSRLEEANFMSGPGDDFHWSN